MALSAKNLKKQIALVKPLLEGRSIETTRRGQSLIGELMGAKHKSSLVYKEHSFDDFTGLWAIPKDERRGGVILYIHGGGYVGGDMKYAKGFASTLATRCGVKVFAPAYRLAPENKFPASLEDCLRAYDYLMEKGYEPSGVMLAGESAGGGLCYSLCQKLRDAGKELPCGIIAISPWTDLTASGESYQKNEKNDPSMSKKLLDFYADSYTIDRRDPLVSPLFAELSGMPPSLIFAGGDEIMLDDARLMHEKLRRAGCKSYLHIAPERWHAYVLYDLQENRDDYERINRFLSRYMCEEKKLRWMRLDNAAKIYPAARHRNWSNVFRISVTLNEDVDREVLKSALDVTARRFPSMVARLRSGLFWYYLEQVSEAPPLSEENSYPLAKMSKKETARCAMRVIPYKRRIAVEYFHSLTDGTGAMIFLKTLTAEYLQQKHGVYIPPVNGVLGRIEAPTAQELEDSFLKYSGEVNASRKEPTAWHLSGTPESGDFLNLTCFKIPVAKVLEKAHEYNISLTAFLCAVMMRALLDLQAEKISRREKRKPVRVLLPVNLRNLFESKTLRNFALYTTPEVDPRLGECSFEDICKAVYHKMGLEINPRIMSAKIATNVSSEKMPIVKIMPLFVKNAVMKAVFNAVGECKSCLSLSNLGAVKLPDEMKPYVERFDFILGVQSSAPYNCGVVSFGDTLYVNFIRNIREAQLEGHFFRVLRDMGIEVCVESNKGDRE